MGVQKWLRGYVLSISEGLGIFVSSPDLLLSPIWLTQKLHILLLIQYNSVVRNRSDKPIGKQILSFVVSLGVMFRAAVPPVIAIHVSLNVASYVV